MKVRENMSALFSATGGRKYGLVLLYCIFVILNDSMKLGISQDNLLNILAAVASYLGVEGIKDAVAAFKTPAK